MAKRIYSESVKKWLIGAGITAGTLITGIFIYLQFIGAITVDGYSGDSICAGTLEDPCYAYINFTANEDIFIYPTDYDPWGRNTIMEFDPAVSSWKLQRSWGSGWRDIPLDKPCTGTWCGLSNSKDERKFSIAFRKGKSYQIRIIAYKKSSLDTIKWGAFDGEIDPVWIGISHDPNYIECLVKTSDSVISKADKSLWTQEQINDDIRTGMKRGYITQCRNPGWNKGNWSWGTLESDPAHFLIVRIPKEEFNESWLEREYDYDNPVCRNIYEQETVDCRDAELNGIKVDIEYPILKERKYIVDLDKLLTKKEYDLIKAIEYNSKSNFTIEKNATDLQSLIKYNDLNVSYSDLRLHGSSGTFTICPSGCNYSTLSDWETDQQADLTGTGPCIANITSGFVDAGGILISGWTTTADDYVKIVTDTPARHNGTWSIDKYMINATDTYASYILEDYVRVDGVQVMVNHPTTSGNGIQLNGITANNRIELSHSILKSDSLSTATGFLSFDPDAIIYVYDNIFYGWNSYGLAGTTGITYLYSNTFYRNARGFSAGATSMIAINNIVSNTTLTPDTNTIVGALNSSTCSYNSIDSADTDLGSNNSYSNQTFLYVSETAGAEDLHLQSGDTGAIDKGLTLGDFSDDIDGQTRSGTWDIGADEYVSGIDSSPPTYSLNQTNSTANGSAIMHSLYWQDDTNLDGYIFSYCNGTYNIIGNTCLVSTIIEGYVILDDNSTEHLNDAYIRTGSGTFYGNLTFLISGDSGGSGNFYIFDMYNISSIPESATITNAELCYNLSTQSDWDAPTQHDVQIYGHDNSSWNEYDISGNNAPNFTNISLQYTNNSLASNTNYLMCGGVTNWISTMYSAGRVNVTFFVNGTPGNLFDANYIQIISKDASNSLYKPYLTINYTTQSDSMNWINDSFVSMIGTVNWSNVTKISQPTAGLNYSWCVYANDSSGNWNGTSCVNPFYYTTAEPAAPAVSVINCTFPNNYALNKIIQMSWGCNVTGESWCGHLQLNGTAGTFNITPTGILNVTTISGHNGTVWVGGTRNIGVS